MHMQQEDVVQKQPYEKPQFGVVKLILDRVLAICHTSSTLNQCDTDPYNNIDNLSG